MLRNQSIKRQTKMYSFNFKIFNAQKHAWAACGIANKNIYTSGTYVH